MNIIAAVSKNWGIGKDNELLFHIKEDMRYFKEHTIGNIVVMGRKTLDSFPGGQPLKDRVNIVMTRNSDFCRDGVVAVHSVSELLDELKKYSGDVFVIGGGEIYNTLLPYCDKAYITKVNADKDADTFMFDFDGSSEWEKYSESESQNNGTVEYKFTVYVKKEN